MKKKWSDKMRFLACLWISGALVSFSHCANANVTCGTNGCSFPDDVWCSTEVETIIEGAPQGAPVQHTAVLLNVTECNSGAADSTCVNPDGPDKTGNWNWSATYSESIANSCTGTDQMGIGLNVAVAAIAQLNLSYAKQVANTCEFTDIYKIEVGETWSYDVPPSTCQTNIATAIWVDGTWTGSSYISASANNGQTVGNGFEGYTVQCSTSNATASGSNRYQNFSETLHTSCYGSGGGA